MSLKQKSSKDPFQIIRDLSPEDRQAVFNYAMQRSKDALVHKEAEEAEEAEAHACPSSLPDFPDSPPWLKQSIQYLCITGSRAFGTHTPDSDRDYIGFCIPPHDVVFPDEIPGFGRQTQRFKQYRHQQGSYDYTIYSIPYYFQHCMENHPTVLETLFVPTSCVVYKTPIANLVLEYRRLFPHKGCYHKFIGYAYSQISKARHALEGCTPKRANKYAYHATRLLLEAEMLLTEGTLNLQRNAPALRDAREGRWCMKGLQHFFEIKKAQLVKLYEDTSSILPHSPPEDEIKDLLWECLKESKE